MSLAFDPCSVFFENLDMMSELVPFLPPTDYIEFISVNKSIYRRFGSECSVTSYLRTHVYTKRSISKYYDEFEDRHGRDTAASLKYLVNAGYVDIIGVGFYEMPFRQHVHIYRPKETPDQFMVRMDRGLVRLYGELVACLMQPRLHSPVNSIGFAIGYISGMSRRKFINMLKLQEHWEKTPLYRYLKYGAKDIVDYMLVAFVCRLRAWRRALSPDPFDCFDLIEGKESEIREFLMFLLNLYFLFKPLVYQYPKLGSHRGCGFDYFRRNLGQADNRSFNKVEATFIFHVNPIKDPPLLSNNYDIITRGLNGEFYTQPVWIDKTGVSIVRPSLLLLYAAGYCFIPFYSSPYGHNGHANLTELEYNFLMSLQERYKDTHVVIYQDVGTVAEIKYREVDEKCIVYARDLLV